MEQDCHVIWVLHSKIFNISRESYESCRPPEGKNPVQMVGPLQQDVFGSKASAESDQSLSGFEMESISAADHRLTGQ